MKEDTGLSKIGRKYVEAHEAHYKKKDLDRALGLYGAIIAAHPDTREAGYSRTQVMNIVRSVVPEKEMLDALVEMALTHLDRDGPSVAELASAETVDPRSHL